MAWFKGTATDYKDMMDEIATIGDDEHISAATIYAGGSGYAIGDTVSLNTGTYDHAPEIEVRGIVTADVVATVASIVAGGTGYSVGDTLNIDGGTFTTACVLEVVTESAGVVTSLQINNPGAYSVQPAGTLTTTALTGSGNDDLTVTVTWTSSVAGIVTDILISDAGAATVTPTDPVATTATIGTGTGLQVDLTWTETAWETLMDYQPAVIASAVVSAGGTGYTVGDTLVVNPGAGTAVESASFTVATVSGTAVATVTPAVDGYYAATPANPAATTSTGGGTGCTLTITWGVYASSTYTDEKVMILHNTVEDVYVGWKSYNRTSTDGDVWLCEGFTGFNTLAGKWEDQPGASGLDIAFVPLHDSSFSYYLSITNRRIVGVFDLGSTINSMYCGLIDPHMTETEYPYPQVILGCITGAQKYTYTSPSYAGLPHPCSASTSYGPGWIRRPDGTFDYVVNGVLSLGNISPLDDYVAIQPTGHQYNYTPTGSAGWYVPSQSKSWWTLVRPQDVDSSQLEHLRRFNDEYNLWPLTLDDNETNQRLLGQMTECYWLDNFDGNLSNADRVWVDGEPYRVFQNCKKTNKTNWWALKEA